MLSFGKYKGKSLSQVMEDDKQYAIWMANSIEDIDVKLDNEDKETLHKYALPYDYIKQKYGISIRPVSKLNGLTEEDIIDILKKEALVKCAYTYVSPESPMGVEGVVKTFYGSTFGGGFGCAYTHYQLLEKICDHLDKANDWFRQYLKNKKQPPMKATYTGAIDAENWTKGKEYNTAPSPVEGFVTIIDDNGAEQLIRSGSTLFEWNAKE